VSVRLASRLKVIGRSLKRHAAAGHLHNSWFDPRPDNEMGAGVT
jgi:hypothetical protein